MSNFQVIADRVELEALRGEFTDAVMMGDYGRVASLFTPDGVLRMPNIPVELTGQEEIRDWGGRVRAFVDFLVQTTHPGSIQLDGDTASGRAYIQELVRLRDDSSEVNYAVYHDGYERTPDGWKFTERTYEIRYLDKTPLAGSDPTLPETSASPAASPKAGKLSGSLTQPAGSSALLSAFTPPGCFVCGHEVPPCRPAPAQRTTGPARPGIHQHKPYPSHTHHPRDRDCSPPPPKPRTDPSAGRVGRRPYPPPGLGSRLVTGDVHQGSCPEGFEPAGREQRVLLREDAMVVGRHRKGKPPGRRQLRLRVAGAGLLAVSACIHLALYLTGYRSIPTVGWLFLLQVMVGFVLVAGALATYSRLAAAAGAAFALSTLGCYLLAVWTGLFGYREVRTRAGIAAGLIEVAAFATLALAALATGTVRQAASPGTKIRTRVHAAASIVTAAVGAVSVLALVLFSVALASAGEAPAAAAGTRITLKTAEIGGVTVLTDATGLTLYWFAPDTPAASACTGSCAAYWPPVTGSPAAGPGVTGKLGTINRPDGTAQATYDGHPLYTYLGDSGSRQARGNDLDLNGGRWFEVRVSG